MSPSDSPKKIDQVQWPEDKLCPLCGRLMKDDTSVNAHHLVPKAYGGREKFAIHKVCHSKIHATFTESELAKELNTFAKLKAHPEMNAFIRWFRRKDPCFTIKHRKTPRVRDRR